MTDREKIIKGLECIAQQAQDGTCGGCAYFRPYIDDPDCGWCDRVAIANDALALLREQEAVKTEPVWFRVVRAGGSSYPFWDCVCEGCGFKTAMAHTDWRFCPECGKPVKWDAAD